jgi:hypothetical protein
VSAAVALAALRQANSVRAALQGAAGGLADAANDVRGALQGLTEEADNTGHFYRGVRFYERDPPLSCSGLVNAQRLREPVKL